MTVSAVAGSAAPDDVLTLCVPAAEDGAIAPMAPRLGGQGATSAWDRPHPAGAGVRETGLCTPEHDANKLARGRAVRFRSL